MGDVVVHASPIACDVSPTACDSSLFCGNVEDGVSLENGDGKVAFEGDEGDSGDHHHENGFDCLRNEGSSLQVYGRRHRPMMQAPPLPPAGTNGIKCTGGGGGGGNGTENLPFHIASMCGSCTCRSCSLKCVKFWTTIHPNLLFQVALACFTTSFGGIFQGSLPKKAFMCLCLSAVASLLHMLLYGMLALNIMGNNYNVMSKSPAVLTTLIIPVLVSAVGLMAAVLFIAMAGASM